MVAMQGVHQGTDLPAAPAVHAGSTPCSVGHCGPAYQLHDCVLPETWVVLKHVSDVQRSQAQHMVKGGAQDGGMRQIHRKRLTDAETNWASD